MTFLRVADFCHKTTAFGPQPACVLWLQGCTRTCPGCIAPMWQDPAGGQEHSVAKVHSWIEQSDMPVLVVSGGEPLDQWQGLHELMRTTSRDARSAILYTGYTYTELLQHSGFQSLIPFFDLLICGPYIEELNDSKGLRGSSNQELIFRTARFEAWREWFVSGARTLEVEIRSDFVRMTGIPPAGMHLNF